MTEAWFSSNSSADFRQQGQWPDVTDERVRAAFSAVPREAFIAPELRQFAGEDAPLPIGQGQTISQPYVVALMVQALALGAGEKILEIGTGRDTRQPSCVR